MSEKIEQLKRTYEYCLVQAIEANFKGEFDIEMSWDDNAKEILRQIETLKDAEVNRKRMKQYEKA